MRGVWPRSTRNTLRLLLLAWAVVTAGAALLIAPRAISHDEAFYLICGLRITHGEVPYRDFFDINPPLIMYMNALPALAARAFDLNPIPLFTVGVTLLSAWSALLADATFRRVRPDARPLERLIVMIVPLGPCALHPGALDPGQREHLFVLLYYPYFLERLATFEGRGSATSRASFARGLLAGAGVCLKPYFLFPVLAVEAGLLASTKRWKALRAPEVAGAIAAAAAYAAAFMLLPRDARDAFLHRILPLVMHGYGAYDGPVLVLVARVGRRVVGVAILIALGARLVRGPLRLLFFPAAFFTLGALAAVVAQHKGWSYHYQPANAGVLLMTGIVIAAGVERTRGIWPAAAPRLRAAFAAVIVIVLIGWRPLYAARAMDVPQYRFRSVIERYSQPGDPVIVLSTSLMYGPPAALQTDRRLASRHVYALLWELAWGAARAGYAPGVVEQRRILSEIAADIRNQRPAAVFIDTEPNCPGCAGRLPRVAKADPELSHALAAYRYRGVEQDMEVYTRRDAR